MKKIKYIILISLILTTICSFSQDTIAEEVNKRFLPKYGSIPYTEAEKEANKKFLNTIMNMEEYKGNKRAASNKFIDLGFSYLDQGDPNTAISRFNQAYLLDSTNTDIYWGYGAYYMSLGKKALAVKQYEEGLAIDSTNTHLLTDYATYYMEQYAMFNIIPQELINPEMTIKKKELFDKSLMYFLKSYKLDPKSYNTVFKLSTLHYHAGDCLNAWKYHTLCENLNSYPIPKGYTKDLKKLCGKN